MADEVTMHSASPLAKPESSAGIFTATTGQQLFVTSAEGIGHNVQSLLLRGKPFEDLGSIAGLSNRPLVMITQDGGTELSRQSQNEAAALRGGASDTEGNYGMEHVRDAMMPREITGTAEVQNVNNMAVPTNGFPMTSTLPEGVNGTADHQNINNVASSSAISNPALSLTFYQQQAMLNQQMFIQQQQTVSALITKVEGLAKMVMREPNRVTDENTKVDQLPTKRARTHAMSDSNVEDVSSDSENSDPESDGYNSDRSEPDNQSESRKTHAPMEINDNSPQITDNMKLLQDLSKELEKAEAVADKVDETLSKVVDTGIRSQIDRNVAKELCNKYQRPENCKGLVVPKVNRELWNTTSLAKTSKDLMSFHVFKTGQTILVQGRLHNSILNGRL